MNKCFNKKNIAKRGEYTCNKYQYGINEHTINSSEKAEIISAVNRSCNAKRREPFPYFQACKNNKFKQWQINFPFFMCDIFNVSADDNRKFENVGKILELYKTSVQKYLFVFEKYTNVFLSLLTLLVVISFIEINFSKKGFGELSFVEYIITPLTAVCFSYFLFYLFYKLIMSI